MKPMTALLSQLEAAKTLEAKAMHAAIENITLAAIKLPRKQFDTVRQACSDVRIVNGLSRFDCPCTAELIDGF
jgi:hypothetical protein